MNSHDLSEVLAGLGRPRVLILGDLILDRYVTGEVSRISPEAPIPVLAAQRSHELLGGAGNVAANLRAMEASVAVMGLVGDDSDGRALVSMLADIGADAGGCVVDASRPTTRKARLMGGIQQMLRIDWEESFPAHGAAESALLDQLAERVANADAVVLSDYGKGVLTPKVIAAAIEAARQAGVPVLVDPKGTDYARYRGATLVTPNRKEAEQALGRRFGTLEELPQGARELIEVAELDAAVITLGADGIFHLERSGASGRVPTVARAVFDVTGAGDTVIAQLALGLGAGLPLGTAVELANQAAGIVVGRRGAAAVDRADLAAVLHHAPRADGKVLAPGDLASCLAAWRAEGKRIAFTNGCFDILHAGHVDYLRFARSKADCLLVGINDDDSVRRLKGPTRPVNPVEDRMAVLAALEMVDAVVAFGQDTPAEIIQRVTPDVLVKGEDWADKGVVGREWVEQHGGAVHLAPLVPGRSTTGIIERARNRADAES